MEDTTLASLEAEESSPSLVLYPNPLQNNTLNIESRLSSPSGVRIQIINSIGQVMRDEDIGNHEAGIVTHEMDVSGLSGGTYLVRVITLRSNMSARLSKR
jgi:hypothetical protein